MKIAKLGSRAAAIRVGGLFLFGKTWKTWYNILYWFKGAGSMRFAPADTFAIHFGRQNNDWAGSKYKETLINSVIAQTY
ncbi:MAG: hypothetical protein IJ657_06845 [Acidaminococcaceae bacterium]|nr:hypothetical protein [Acidaminococcaceae bacterium]